MSWYTYFKLKPDSKFNNVTIEECERKMKNDNSFFKTDYKAELLATMIQAYYEPDVRKKRSMIATLVFLAVTRDNTEYDYVKDILEDEKHILDIKHCQTEYEMHETVDTWDEKIKDVVTDLVILATVRFEPDNKYSDTPKSTMEYLRYEYINEINEKMDYLEDESYDYYRYKFLLEECDMVGDEGIGLAEELGISEKETSES